MDLPDGVCQPECIKLHGSIYMPMRQISMRTNAISHRHRHGILYEDRSACHCIILFVIAKLLLFNHIHKGMLHFLRDDAVLFWGRCVSRCYAPQAHVTHTWCLSAAAE